MCRMRMLLGTHSGPGTVLSTQSTRSCSLPKDGASSPFTGRESRAQRAATCPASPVVSVGQTAPKAVLRSTAKCQRIRPHARQRGGGARRLVWLRTPCCGINPVQADRDKQGSRSSPASSCRRSPAKILGEVGHLHPLGERRQWA